MSWLTCCAASMVPSSSLRTAPCCRFFGIEPVPALPPLEWSPEYHIEKYTPAWRQVSPGREKEWAIAIACYGFLTVCDQNGLIKTWDTSRGAWEAKGLPFDDWIDGVFSEGDIMLKELLSDNGEMAEDFL